MNNAPDISDYQWPIYWEREYTTAIAPVRLKLEMNSHRPSLTNMPLTEQRELAASGYKVLPDDCGPVRMVSQYGWLVRCSVDCKLRRTKDGFKWQAPEIKPEERLLGYKSFSGIYVDTILNSGYAQTVLRDLILLPQTNWHHAERYSQPFLSLPRAHVFCLGRDQITRIQTHP